MKLSDWAKQQGVSYKTARRLYKSGKFPLPVEQLPTGTIIVHEKKQPASEDIVLHARVSSHSQKADLDRPLQRLRDYAAVHGLWIRMTLVTHQMAVPKPKYAP